MKQIKAFIYACKTWAIGEFYGQHVDFWRCYNIHLEFLRIFDA